MGGGGGGGGGGEIPKQVVHCCHQQTPLKYCDAKDDC